jgi:alpha-D-ribose 1-methylphosphonate 5-triphosphate synthase subunit PhnH
MLASTESIDGGFSDPVFDSQAVFKAVMDAMARPGTVIAVKPVARPPSPLSPTAACVALTLCDSDTPLWLDPPLQASATTRSYLAFHTGAPLAQAPAEAALALVCDPGALIQLDCFAQGTQEYPDRSATLILQVESLSSGELLHLGGPGIRKAASMAPSPMPRRFVEQWRENRARFPRGIDLVLAAPGSIACLPRTTRIRGTEG